jgi:hypothetical protein
MVFSSSHSSSSSSSPSVSPWAGPFASYASLPGPKPPQAPFAYSIAIEHTADHFLSFLFRIWPDPPISSSLSSAAAPEGVQWSFIRSKLLFLISFSVAVTPFLVSPCRIPASISDLSRCPGFDEWLLELEHPAVSSKKNLLDIDFLRCLLNHYLLHLPHHPFPITAPLFDILHSYLNDEEFLPLLAQELHVLYAILKLPLEVQQCFSLFYQDPNSASKISSFLVPATHTS